MAAVNAGWGFEEFQELVLSDGPAIATAYRARLLARGQRATARWLHEQVWERAVEQVRRRPARRQAAPDEIRHLAAAVETLPWPPRGGPSQRAVYLALLDLAAKAGNRTLFASIRTIQQAAGIPSRSTVDRALRALERQDLLEWAGLPGQLTSGRTGRARLTTRWKLPTRHLKTVAAAGAGEESFRTAVASVGHDAFYNRSGLGKAAHRALSALISAPGRTAAELAAGLGLAPRTARTHLRLLARFGLAEADADGHWYPVQRDLDTVAADLGNQGRAQRLRQAIELEREGYDTYR
jgi:DNA-binding transcriptional ArsR family regulator